MRTWRERIAAAKAAGRFSEGDEELYNSRSTCLAAEVASAYGIEWDGETMMDVTRPEYTPRRNPWARLWEIGEAAGDCGRLGSPQRAERVLDLIEDEAIKLKREMFVKES